MHAPTLMRMVLGMALLVGFAWGMRSAWPGNDAPALQEPVSGLAGAGSE